MAEKSADGPGEPPSVAGLSIASTANAGTLAPLQPLTARLTADVGKAVEQSIDPWSVSAAVDEQGNTLQFDYEAISK